MLWFQQHQQAGSNSCNKSKNRYLTESLGPPQPKLIIKFTWPLKQLIPSSFFLLCECLRWIECKLKSISILPRKKELSLRRLSAQRDFWTGKNSGRGGEGRGRGGGEYLGLVKKKKKCKEPWVCIQSHSHLNWFGNQRTKPFFCFLFAHHLLFSADGLSNVAAWLSRQRRRIGSSWAMCSQHSDPAQILV